MSTICENTLRHALLVSDLDILHNFFLDPWYGDVDTLLHSAMQNLLVHNLWNRHTTMASWSVVALVNFTSSTISSKSGTLTQAPFCGPRRTAERSAQRRSLRLRAPWNNPGMTENVVPQNTFVQVAIALDVEHWTRPDLRLQSYLTCNTVQYFSTINL